MEAHLSQNNIPTAVYEQLIEAVHDALPEMYRYVRLRRKMLGVKELHMYDVYTPLTQVSMPLFLLRGNGHCQQRSGSPGRILYPAAE